MSGMNPWLAGIYGTDGADDLEKTAQSHLLNKLAQDNNIDLSQLSEEDVQALLQEVMGEQVMQQGQQAAPQVNTMAPQSLGLPPGTDMNPTQARPAQHPAMAQAFAQQPQVPQGMPQQAMQPQGGADMASMQKEAQAKFEEADLLGRVMAHAYTQELEKIAGAKADAVKGAVGKAGKFVKDNKKAVGAAAGAGAAGFAAGRMSKKASAGGPAFMKLAEMHAADILSASGFDPASGQDMYAQQGAGDQQQQVAPDQQAQAPQGQEGVQQDGQPGGEQFAAALDETALNMLAEAGYDVNEILARLQFSQQNNGQA